MPQRMGLSLFHDFLGPDVMRVACRSMPGLPGHGSAISLSLLPATVIIKELKKHPGNNYRLKLPDSIIEMLAELILWRARAKAIINMLCDIFFTFFSCFRVKGGLHWLYSIYTG